MRKKILLVEDCPLSRTLIQKALTNEYELTCVASGEDALILMNQQTFDLYIFDVILPQVSGYQLCTELRRHQNSKIASSPLFFLSSKSSSEEVLLGFNLGANDYIKKPFNVMELKARVDVYLKGRKSPTQNKQLEFKEIKIDQLSKRVFIKESEVWNEVRLTSTEYKLLVFFLENQNKLLHRDEIRNTVWEPGTHLSARTIDTHISKLRKKLKHASDCIEAIYSEGYRCAA